MAHVHGDGIEKGKEMPFARAKRENIGTFSRLRFTIARAKLHSLHATDHAFLKKRKRPYCETSSFVICASCLGRTRRLSSDERLKLAKHHRIYGVPAGCNKDC